MKTINICKAQPVSCENVEPVVITIVDELPSWIELPAFFDNEAKQLADTLLAVLPGGTYDRLVGYMLAQKASRLLVRSE